LVPRWALVLGPSPCLLLAGKFSFEVSAVLTLDAFSLFTGVGAWGSMYGFRVLDF
jgi:hypothetical protein